MGDDTRCQERPQRPRIKPTNFGWPAGRAGHWPIARPAARPSELSTCLKLCELLAQARHSFRHRCCMRHEPSGEIVEELHRCLSRLTEELQTSRKIAALIASRRGSACRIRFRAVRAAGTCSVLAPAPVELNSSVPRAAWRRSSRFDSPQTIPSVISLQELEEGIRAAFHSALVEYRLSAMDSARSPPSCDTRFSPFPAGPSAPKPEPHPLLPATHWTVVEAPAQASESTELAMHAVEITG